MNLERSVIQLGLSKPVKLLHVTDTHLALADESDNEALRQFAKSRSAILGKSTSNDRALKEMLAYAHENCDLLIHSGDLMDFISNANLNIAREIVTDERVFFIPGNRDYARLPREDWENNTYRMNSYLQVHGKMNVNLLFSARVVGGANIVAVDNSYYQFEEWQRWRLEREIEKGLPILLVTHVPLFEPGLFGVSMCRNQSCAYLTGCDEDRISRFDEYSAVQQRPSEDTLAFIEFVKANKLIRAVLCGHLHFNYESELCAGTMQYVTGAGFNGAAREITLA